MCNKNALSMTKIPIELFIMIINQHYCHQKRHIFIRYKRPISLLFWAMVIVVNSTKKPYKCS